jgi:hypothetical protein
MDLDGSPHGERIFLRMVVMEKDEVFKVKLERAGASVT